MRVAVLGRTRMLFDTIQHVIDDGHEITLIGTCKAAPEYDITETDFQNKAIELGVPFFCDARINSDAIIQKLRESHADIAISVNWLTIIKEEAISCFKYGILNAHCGDLPKYRGNACPNWAIINGETQMGISIHYMTPGELDSGDIVLKKYYPLNPSTTISEIYDYIIIEIPKMFSEALNIISNDPSDVTPQSRRREDIFRCYPRIESDSIIDWNADMQTIDRIVRASSSPFNGAYTYCNDNKFYIHKVSMKSYETPCSVCPGQVVSIDKNRHNVGVACKDGIILIESVKNANGDEISPEDCFPSMRIRLGYCVQDEIYNLKKQINEMKILAFEENSK